MDPAFFPPTSDLDKLLAYCRKLDRNTHEDLFQDSIVRFLENRHKFSEYRYALLATIARNLLIDRYRKKKVRPIVTHELPENGYMDHEIDSVDFDAPYMDAIEGMGECRHRRVLLLWMEGLSYKEIKEELSISQGAVAGALSSARSKVREKIKEAV